MVDALYAQLVVPALAGAVVGVILCWLAWRAHRREMYVMNQVLEATREANRLLEQWLKGAPPP